MRHKTRTRAADGSILSVAAQSVCYDPLAYLSKFELSYTAAPAILKFYHRSLSHPLIRLEKIIDSFIRKECIPYQHRLINVEFMMF